MNELGLVDYIRAGGPTDRRYITLNKSASGHCCFEASVIDLEEFELQRDDGGYPINSAVCECFDEATAEEICAALNAQTPPSAALGALITKLCAKYKNLEREVSK